MAYQPWSVIAGETPTASKWNILGSNDDNFNTRIGQLEADKLLYTNSDSSTITFDLSVSKIHTVTLGGNRTLAVSNVSPGMVFIITLKQDNNGGRTVTWWSGISWAGGYAPVLTTTAGKADTFGFICTDNNTYYGYVVGQNI